VVACVTAANGARDERTFNAPFLIGSDPECALRIRGAEVEPRHVQVLRDGISWWIRNLAGPGRAYVNGAPAQFVPLEGEAQVQLGKGGPVVSLRLAEQGASEPVAPAATPPAPGRERELSEAEIIERYIKPAGGAPAGRQTMMFRAAFQRVQKRSSRRYHLVIGAILLVLVSAGAVIAYQRQKLQSLQATAERFFYTRKALELRTAQLEEVVLANAAPEQVAALGESRERLKQMEGEYDAFVRELGAYGRLSERQRYILRVARRFGECEVNIPGDFVSEVEHYIARWRQNGSLGNALRRAKQHGYGVVITRAFAQAGLPPQYVYLALQESGFDDRAIGTPTRYGFAKGMWQFISLTGHQYGLRIGPLYEQAVFDPQDERFDWPKATRAATRYIRKLTTTDAQGSGLLVMASYNWGEGKVRPIILSMPENPRERNFWQLLARHDVPKETRDYVLSIFSAAVICENPSLFGFDVECPIPPQPRIDELGRDRPSSS
jgi:membrane-bound lytic murein transglycosylase D